MAMELKYMRLSEVMYQFRIETNAVLQTYQIPCLFYAAEIKETALPLFWAWHMPNNHLSKIAIC